MTHSAYVYFGIYGDFDPNELSSRLTLSPCHSVVKDSKDAVNNIPKTSILRYAQIESDAVVPDVYELSEKAVSLLEPQLEALVTAMEDFKAEATFQVVLGLPAAEEVSTPIIGFSSRVIAFVAATKASIDIDTYRN